MNGLSSIIVDAKMGGLHVQAELKKPQSLDALVNHPPKENSVIRVAHVPGTRGASRVLYWKDEDNKRREAEAVVI